MNTYYCLDDSPRFEMIELNEIDSTNNFLKSYRPLQPKEVTLVTAEFQTAGRGQIGNSWESESGENLLFSLLIHPQNIEASQQFLISQISALSAKEALEAFTDGLSVKWPNDIYWHDKKIGGMLIENDLSGHTITNCIIGIGLNINQEKFHSPAPNPISLFQIIGKKIEKRFVLERFMKTFNTRISSLKIDGGEQVKQDYIQALYRRNGMHPYADETGRFEARIVKIEPTGHIVLEKVDGSRHTYAFKEVKHLIPLNQETDIAL